MKKREELGTQESKLLGEKDQLDEVVKKLNASISAVEQKLITEREEQGIGEFFDIEGVGTIKFKDMLSTKLDDRDAYSKWLEENGMTHIATYSVHYSKTKSLCEELLKERKETPAGITVSTYTKCSLK